MFSQYINSWASGFQKSCIYPLYYLPYFENLMLSCRYVEERSFQQWGFVMPPFIPISWVCMKNSISQTELDNTFHSKCKYNPILFLFPQACVIIIQQKLNLLTIWTIIDLQAALKSRASLAEIARTHPAFICLILINYSFLSQSSL